MANNVTHVKGEAGYQAYRILQVAFVLVPLLAGLDKFFYMLADWHRYISPHATQLVQGEKDIFMMVVGVIEIVAAIGIIFKPKIFAYIVALWLLGIIINLVLTGQYYDIALRDFGLMLGAVALGRLSQQYS